MLHGTAGAVDHEQQILSLRSRASSNTTGRKLEVEVRAPQAATALLHRIGRPALASQPLPELREHRLLGPPIEDVGAFVIPERRQRLSAACWYEHIPERGPRARLGLHRGLLGDRASVALVDKDSWHSVSINVDEYALEVARTSGGLVGQPRNALGPERLDHELH